MGPMRRSGETWVAVIPAGHSLGRVPGGRVLFARLAREPFVLATGGCTMHARSLAQDAGFDLADVRVEVRDWNSAFALVREGLGVTLVPEPTLLADCSWPTRAAPHQAASPHFWSVRLAR